MRRIAATRPTPRSACATWRRRCFLRPRFKALHSVTLFSATLAPPDYAIQLLGLPEDTAWIDVPPAFPPEHLTVRVADGLSTRYAAPRALARARWSTVIARQFDEHPGNYLAFFSSFDYLEQAAALLAALRPDIAAVAAGAAHGRRRARRTSWRASGRDGRGIGFAVLGGVFAEGVDLPGSLLIGAFIATLGLPPVSRDAGPHPGAAGQAVRRRPRLCRPGAGDAEGGAGGGPRAAHARRPRLALAAGRPLPAAPRSSTLLPPWWQLA